MKILSSKEVYKNPLFSVVEHQVENPDGAVVHRGVVRHPGAVVILAVDSKKRIAMVRQYRVPAQKDLWELPAGVIDPGEKPIQSARRELKEETGCTARKWTKLVVFYASPGYVDEKLTVYLAEDLKLGKAEPTPDEHLNLRWFTKKELDTEILEGRFFDGKTLVALYAWRLRK